MRTPDDDEMANWNRNTLMASLGIEFLGLRGDGLAARMPVDHRTKQIHGLLHGGASAALAETVGSLAGFLSVDRARFRCVGIELNANHLRGVREGFVTALARPLHVGRSTHVWQIDITDDAQRLVCVSRLTLAVVSVET